MEAGIPASGSRGRFFQAGGRCSSVGARQSTLAEGRLQHVGELSTGLVRPVGSHPGHLLELLEVSTDIPESGVDLLAELRELAADQVRIGGVWYLHFARLKGTNLTTAVSANDDLANFMPLQRA